MIRQMWFFGRPVGTSLTPTMNVLLLSLALLCQYPGDVTGQFTAPPPTCPGDTFTFRCTVTGDRNGITIWRVGGGSSQCSLLHSKANSPGPCGTSPFIVTTETGFGTSSTSFSSTLSGTALNSTVVECFGPRLARDAENRVGISTLQIVGPPSVSTLSCVGLSEGVSGAVNVTLSWTLSGGDNADFFLINITTNAPQTPYGGLLNITTANVALTGFMAGYEYNITVHGVNCESQEGRESEPLTITPQGPTIPSNCNITLSYNQTSGRLLFINSTWNTVPDPEDPAGACPGPSGDITQFQISFQSGSVVVTESVNISMCTAGRCSHTFEPSSNSSSSYDNVSVAAENVVGVGAARTCTTQTISTINNILTGKVVNISSPTDAQLQCTFLSGFTGSARCTVQYGMDPTYMNLPYSAESTETGTAGNSVSVVLRERMNSSTVYYYTMSVFSGNFIVLMWGTFRTPEYRCSLMDLWNLPATDATILTDISFLNDSAAQYQSCDASSVGSIALVNTTLNTATVAYYTGTTAGSRACFVCDESSGYELSATITERFCQGNALWSETAILYVCTLPQWNIALIVIGASAMLFTLLTAIAITPIVTNSFHSNNILKWWHITLLVIGALAVVPGIALIVIGIVVYCQRKNKEMKTWPTIVYINLMVITVILCIIGMALWIAVGVVTANPPSGNTCDPGWQCSRDALIASAYVATVLARFFTAAMVWVYAFHNKNKKLRLWRIVLLLIASIIGVGLLFALAVIACSDKDTGDNQGTGDKKASENLSELQAVKPKEEEERYINLYASNPTFPKSNKEVAVEGTDKQDKQSEQKENEEAAGSAAVEETDKQNRKRNQTSVDNNPALSHTADTN